MWVCLSRKFKWRNLQKYCTDLFQKAGLSENDAHIVAESLVLANLRGVYSHGVVRADIYLRRLEAGMIDIHSEMEVSNEGPITLLDGNNQIGAIVGTKALEIAIEKTKNYGTSIVGVKESNHFGTCAYYLNKAIQNDIIMIIMSNASQTMPPIGGVRPFI